VAGSGLQAKRLHTRLGWPMIKRGGGGQGSLLDLPAHVVTAADTHTAVLCMVIHQGLSWTELGGVSSSTEGGRRRARWKWRRLTVVAG
jgi:hypothetical protein